MSANMMIRDDLSTGEVIDLIFRDPEVRHGLSEFEDIGKEPDEALNIFPKMIEAGRAKGEVRYYLKDLKRGVDLQVYSGKHSNPEEIVRQLWMYKLHHVYDYPFDYMAIEYPVVFGTVTAPKAADIVVFQQDGSTAKIVVEVKRPDRRDGINQLKSYLNAEGSPIGVWSNGRASDRIILYRPYPREFENTLSEIPTFNQQPEDVLEAKLTLNDLKRNFDFKQIIQNLEELVLASAGVDEFNEIFKIIFAKIYDEKAARGRKNEEVAFRQTADPHITYETIDKLFRKSMEEWPGIFDENEHIKLTPQHLQVVIGPLVRIQLLGANMRIMDDAFEYLMPSVAKKKNGQFFTPRYVIDMCVKMLNPAKQEYVLDPACGSAGFLIHTLEHTYPSSDNGKKETQRNNYAAKYLWGMDFDERSARVARALMLIAGDGRSHIFRVNSLNPREWFTSQEGEGLRAALREANLLVKKPPTNRTIRESEAWDFYHDMKFDVLLTNPPFAGEIRDNELLRHYNIAGKASEKKDSKEERDVLFIERCLHLLKPGGRLAIILPQGKFNNSTMAYIREWILRRARLLAVVGLHPNTFKPHTGTKTSVLFIQKYTDVELAQTQQIEDSIREESPDYRLILQELIDSYPADEDISEDELPEEVQELLSELFGATEDDGDEGPRSRDDQDTDPEPNIETLEADKLEREITLTSLRLSLDKAKKLKDKDSQKKLRTQIRTAERALAETISAIKRCTLKGRIELVLEDPKSLEELRQKWIDTEVGKRLDYPVFMAISEMGGKDASGEYVYREDLAGNVLEDIFGNQLIEQDCVKYRDIDPDAIAEQYVRWAKKQQVSFWQEQ